MSPAKRPRISPETLKKLKDAVNIIDVIGEHVVLRKAGSNYVGLCPFHSERSPSFNVSAQKQLYRCHGCERGGDVVRFLEELHGISFVEAVEELAERSALPLPPGWEGGGDKEDPAEAARRRATRDKVATAYKLNRFVAAFYHHTLARDVSASQYLAGRGVTAEELRSFYVGYAPPAWEALASHLIAKKAPLELAVELGLIRASTRAANRAGSGYFDLFRNRVMFPIVDLRGKVVGFGGRTLPGGVELQGPSQDASEKAPKYLNSTESQLFHKGKVAFGLFQAQKHIREKRELVLVEGYFDVAVLHACGFKHAVATCGTALTVDHLTLFRRFADKITILFDGDKAGVSATERAMEVGLEQGLVLHAAAMPTGLDPDELLLSEGKPSEEGKQKMNAILAAAEPILDARIEAELKNANAGPEARVQAIKKIGGWLTRLRDPVGKQVRIQDLQKRLGVSAQLLGGNTSGGSSPRSEARPLPRPSVGSKPGRTPPWSGAEKILLRALVRGGKWAETFRETQGRLPPGSNVAEVFDHPTARAWVQSRLRPQAIGNEAVTQFDAGDPHEEGVDSQISAILIEEAMNPDGLIDSPDLRTLLDKRVAKVWARFSQQIKAAIADAEAKKDAGLEKKLKQEYLDVQRKMKEFTSFYDEA